MHNKSEKYDICKNRAFKIQKIESKTGVEIITNFGQFVGPKEDFDQENKTVILTKFMNYRL